MHCTRLTVNFGLEQTTALHRVALAFRIGDDVHLNVEQVNMGAEKIDANFDWMKERDALKQEALLLQLILNAIHRSELATARY